MTVAKELSVFFFFEEEMMKKARSSRGGRVGIYTENGGCGLRGRGFIGFVKIEMSRAGFYDEWLLDLRESLSLSLALFKKKNWYRSC